MKILIQYGLLLVLLLSLLAPSPLQAQKKKKAKNTNTTAMNEAVYGALQWRSIGPYRGGRATAVTGVPGHPNLFYFGASGGGIWRTEDGGRQWENISDGFFGGSVGAIAVSAADRNVIYAGGGEKTVRGNVSSGYGVWRSEDAGKTWEQRGLLQSRHISRIRIHPNDPNVVYAAVMGNIYNSHSERGVFRSRDGGKNWEKVLYVNDEVGAVDLLLDPSNPRIIYASTWRVKRTPYSMSSGGEGSGLWKSTDSGDNWENISRNEGLPKDTLGIIGVAVSPVKPERIWAIIEAKDGGLFRSDDSGKTWKKLNDHRKIRQRAWYYTRVYADPKDEDLVYVLNVRYHRSKDGGKTFKAAAAPHGDHHDLWIAPEDPNRMIIGDDGGAQISYDRGTTWSTYHNQPTAQFYRVTTDNDFPYRIYVAQQDNSTLRIRHRSSGASIDEDDWERTAGCECGHIAVDPINNDIVYGGCYDGQLQRLDHENDQRRSVNVWPDNPMGHGAEGMRYRFQWNFPLFFSPHDPKKLYAASNHLHVSYNGGQSWEIISPDLTRNDSTKLGPSGGPITKDNTSVEYYCTIFAAAESPLKKDLLWAGSDDGLVHVSRDGGKNWENVTPGQMPEWSMINSIEPDPFNEGGAYIAATLYKTGDFRPYLYKTSDYGKTWTKITNGINEEHFTRVLRADSVRKGLLYAGTETGMYVSFDDGKNWQSFQLNLPIVPITDLALKGGHLIAATQGRSIWMIDDLGPIRQMEPKLANKAIHLFKPIDSYRMRGFQMKKPKNAGMNHASGVNLYYYLQNEIDTHTVKLGFYTSSGTLIREFSNKAKEKENKLKVEQGANSFNWNLRYPNAKKFKGMVLWWASLNGPMVVPGSYKARLEWGEQSEEVSFQILKDERSDTELADFQKQFDFLMSIRDKVSEAHQAIMDIRDIRQQVKQYTARLEDKTTYKAIHELAQSMDSTMTEVEKAIYQTQNQSPQDPLNFPIRLTNKLAHLTSLNQDDFPPTDQAIAVKNELSEAIDRELAKFEQLKTKQLPELNALIRSQQIDAIMLPKRESE
ncbi:MAG: glycosyl hydrolase [Bacteroidota bacterium]